MKQQIVPQPQESGGAGRRRSFVFLQGPTSGAFRDLGRALAARGHAVVRVNFCPGDWLFWRGRDCLSYRGTLADWPDFLSQLITARSATDLVYFADRFPYHRRAQGVAQRMGVRAVAMEYGYLRPDWLILEEGGNSAYSHFPEDPETLRSAARDLPAIAPGACYRVPASDEALRETVFHLANGFLGWLMPHYAPNRYYPVLREFPAYVPRLIRRARNARAAQARIAQLSQSSAPRFLVPLQMQNDYQLRDNAPPGYQLGFVQQVLDSFARHAPAEAHLVFKMHPMDNGLEHWDRRIADLCRAMGLTARVHVLDGGDVDAVMAMADGCVVINSTMGLHALRAGVPTKVMGISVYDIAGLTHQGSLDSFWDNPAPPDPELLEALVRTLAHGIHVRGSVYGAAGRAAFVANAVARLESPALHGHGLHHSPPPRLGRAARLGIAVDWPGDPGHRPGPAGAGR
jgi:capsular polysaccharide export protein